SGPPVTTMLTAMSATSSGAGGASSRRASTASNQASDKNGWAIGRSNPSADFHRLTGLQEHIRELLADFRYLGYMYTVRQPKWALVRAAAVLSLGCAVLVATSAPAPADGRFVPGSGDAVANVGRVVARASGLPLAVTFGG